MVRTFPRTGCEGVRCTRSSSMASAVSLATFFFCIRCSRSFLSVTVGGSLPEEESSSIPVNSRLFLMDWALRYETSSDNCWRRFSRSATRESTIPTTMSVASTLSSSFATLSSVRLTRSSSATHTFFNSFSKSTTFRYRDSMAPSFRSMVARRSDIPFTQSKTSRNVGSVFPPSAILASRSPLLYSLGTKHYYPDTPGLNLCYPPWYPHITQRSLALTHHSQIDTFLFPPTGRAKL